MDVARTARSLAACGALVTTLACGGAPAPRTPAQELQPPAPAAATPGASVRPAVHGPVAQGGSRLPVDALLEEYEAGEAEARAAEDAAAVLADSLEAFESATLFWEQGSLDDAFAALDRAYELMASVPADGDPALAQEKENLRSLISRRVVEIYASRRTSVGDLDRAIPRVVNEDVQREIARFQGPERSFFLDSYRRSGRYRPMIVAKLQAAGLPEQLSWLPLVESGFKSRALSSARALGLWQFISSTGYRYGLERSAWIDERMDPEKATDAAIGYLTDLHGLFGDWLTALAGYNCGENAVLRQIHNQPVSYFDRFWDLYERLPRETRRYVPRFLATLAILEDPEGYGFDLPEPYPPVPYEAVEVARATELAALERSLGLGDGTLADLNPELRLKATPPAAYPLRVPVATGATVLASLAELPAYEPPQTTFATHRVRGGETLSSIARRYGTSVHSLMTLNRLRSAHRISPGQQLQVAGSASAGGAGGVYVVRRGDTLGAIARRQGVALSRLMQANQLSSRSTIYPGQQLTIPR